MKQTLFQWLLLLSLFTYGHVAAISIVYNFRIGQITKQPISEHPKEDNSTLLALVFDQYQKKHTDTSQNFPGILNSFIYNFGYNFFRADFAFSHIHEQTNGTTTFSGTETDDLLFTLGRNFKLNSRNTVTLSGLFGVPTHSIVTLKHVGFGYGQIGTGIQFDGAHTLHRDDALLYGVRYIYFVPRSARDSLENDYTFTIGNLVDLLFAYKNWWHQHGLEVGVTERFDFGAHITPHLDDIVQRTNYIRTSFYAVYKYKFLIKDLPNRFLFNVAYGFDQKSKEYSNKFIVTVWGSWSINF